VTGAGYHRTQSLTLDTMLPGDRITDEFLWPDALAPGDYRVSVTEDGSGRHGATFATTTRLAAEVHPATPALIPAVSPPASHNGFPAWILLGGIAAGAGVTIPMILVIASARRRRLAEARW
jgi:hypothetical protein